MVIKKSKCLFCSLGCGVAFRTEGDQVTALDYDKENPVNLGSLCPRGHYNIELIDHPGRLNEPRIGSRIVSWEDAISFIKQELKLFQKDEIGIVISSIASNEDARAAAKLANSMGTKNICAAGYLPDLDAYQGERDEGRGERGTLEDIEKAEALLIVGDILNRSPVLSKRINKVKYGKRGNKIIVIDPNKTHTSWFATDHLANRPGTEAVVLAAMLDGGVDAAVTGLAKGRIEKAAKDFAASAAGVIIVVPGAEKERNDLIVMFARKLAAASPNKKQITYFMYGNTVEVCSVIDREAQGHISYNEMVGKVDAGEIKAMLMFGEDLSASHPEMEKKFKMLRFAARSDHFNGSSALNFDTAVLLPLASQHDGLVAPKVGTKTNFEIIEMILGEKVPGQGPAPEIPAEKFDLKEKIEELKNIKGKEKSEIEPIVNFGNNAMAKNFFWYRSNPNG